MHPYTKVVTASCESGDTTVVTIPVPPDGVLNRLIVKQTDGTKAGFSFETMNVDEAGTYDPELYRLQAKQTITAGNDTSEQYGLELGYNNAEGESQNASVRAIYLWITPDGADAKPFQIAVTVFQAIDP